MNATFEAREELLRDIRNCSLLILDDFGMERDSEFGKEIIFQVIDARYQSRKPMIITTNLSMNTLQNPADTSGKRIYDRILEMCLPVKFLGKSLRTDIRRQKMEQFRKILYEKAESTDCRPYLCGNSPIHNALERDNEALSPQVIKVKTCGKTEF